MSEKTKSAATAVELHVELHNDGDGWMSFPWSFEVRDTYGGLLKRQTSYMFRWYALHAARRWCRAEAERRTGSGRLRFTYRAEVDGR